VCRQEEGQEDEGRPRPGRLSYLAECAHSCLPVSAGLDLFRGGGFPLEGGAVNPQLRLSHHPGIDKGGVKAQGQRYITTWVRSLTLRVLSLARPLTMNP
jgi:hypothetical protein